MKITPPESGSRPALGATGIGGSTTLPDAGDIAVAGGYFGAGTVEEALAAIAAALTALQGTTTTRYWPLLALTSGPTAGTMVADLDDLTDVVISAPAVLDHLYFTGSAWVNTASVWSPVSDGAGGVLYDAGTGAIIMAFGPL